MSYTAVKYNRTTTNLNPQIWNQPHFRNLTATAQWLYLHLTTNPNINPAGVQTWHPGRIAATTTDLIPDDIHHAAQQLTQHDYITIDPQTEEVAITNYATTNIWLKTASNGTSTAHAVQNTASRTIRQKSPKNYNNSPKTTPTTPHTTAKPCES